MVTNGDTGALVDARTPVNRAWTANAGHDAF